MSPRLPIEVIESVVDHSWDEPQTLCCLSATCRDLRPRGLCRLVSRVELISRDRSFLFCGFLEANPNLKPLVHSITINPRDFAPVPLLHILPNLFECTMYDPTMPYSNRLKPAVPIHVSTLTCFQFGSNVQRLTFNSTTFETSLELCRILTAFTCLQHLTCIRVWARAEGNTQHLNMAKHRLPKRLKLRTLILYGEAHSYSHDVLPLLLSLSQGTLETLIIRTLCGVSRSDDLLRITRDLHISAPASEPESHRIHYVIHLLNQVRPTTLKAVTVEIYSQSVLEICRNFGQQDFTLRCAELERTLLKFSQPTISWRVGKPINVDRVSFWTRKIGQQFPTLDERRAVKIGAPTHSRVGHDGRVCALHVSNNGLRVITASEDRTIIVWDTGNGKVVDQWLTHSEISYLAISPDSHHFVYGGGDNMLTIRCIGSCQTHLPVTLQGHANRVSACAWSPDGAVVASGSVDGVICLWNAQSSQLLHSTEHVHTRAARIIQFSPDGRWLASYGEDDLYCMWDRVSANPLMVIKPILGPSWTGGFQCVSFHPGGSLFATLSRASIHIWDVNTKEERATWKSRDRLLKTVQFSPDGKLALSLSHNSSIVEVWDACYNILLTSLAGHAGEVVTACFSPCGKYIASGSKDSTVRLWRIGDGSCVAILPDHGGSVEHVKFSPDGRILSSAGEDGGVCVRCFAEAIGSA